MPFRALAFWLSSSVILAACATAGSTYQSGVGDKMIESPPYYAGAAVTPAAIRFGHLPIRYQAGAVNPENFDPSSDPDSPMADLLEQMNRYLDSLGATVAMRPATEPPGTPIDVYFGCPRAGGISDCEERDNSGALGRTRTYMSLLVRRPSNDWAMWLGSSSQRSGVPAVLVITLEVSDYLLKQRGILGTKELQLGTDYSMSLPWLTSLETPVSVLQLTGALVATDGKAIRIGAEGMLARRTAIVASAIEAQSLIRDKDVKALITATRDDITGNPLVWQVALRNLVAQLTGRTDLAVSAR